MRGCIGNGSVSFEPAGLLSLLSEFAYFPVSTFGEGGPVLGETCFNFIIIFEPLGVSGGRAKFIF